MGKPSVCKQWREINAKIFQNVVRYVTGPKLTCDYAIDCLHKDTYSNVIRVRRGYEMPKCDIYFDYRIRISVSYCRKNKFYDLQSRDFQLPTDDFTDDYVYDVSQFLREFIRHVNKIEDYPGYHLLSSNVTSVGGYVDSCPDILKSVIHSHISLLFFEYSVDDMEAIRYITDVMRSKAFRRSRGDYK